MPGIILCVLAYFAILSFIHRHDSIKTLEQRQLSACPNTPNCVLSHSSIKHEVILPFDFIQNNPALSWQRFTQMVRQSGGKVLVNDGTYLHAVFTSALFRFKDDLEAQLSHNHIDIRSASRAGVFDFGKNRQRIEQIRKLYLH